MTRGCWTYGTATSGGRTTRSWPTPCSCTSIASRRGEHWTPACKAVRPGGLLALTLKDGDGEPWSDAKLCAPRWFVYWREEALRDLLSEVGWHVLHLWKVQGRTEPWLHVLCER